MGKEWKTWSQLIAPSFHGNTRPFPPTLFFSSLSSLSLLSASPTPSLLSHLIFCSVPPPLFLRMCLYNHITALLPLLSLIPPSFLSFHILSFPFYIVTAPQTPTVSQVVVQVCVCVCVVSSSLSPSSFSFHFPFPFYLSQVWCRFCF